jgi:hypothetical protein
VLMYLDEIWPADDDGDKDTAMVKAKNKAAGEHIAVAGCNRRLFCQKSKIKDVENKINYLLLFSAP